MVLVFQFSSMLPATVSFWILRVFPLVLWLSADHQSKLFLAPEVPLLAFIMEASRMTGTGHTGPTGINESWRVHGKLSGCCGTTAILCLISILLFTERKKKQENFIDIKWIAQHHVAYGMNIWNYWLNVLHLSDPSTSLASTMCRFLALYTMARFYLLRRLSIEVNVDYIKLLKNMEKCIVPEILNQPIQQHHLFLILVTVSQLGWKGQTGYWSRIKRSRNQRASASWFHIISKSPTRYSHHRHHLSVFTALQTNCHSAAWSLFNSSDTHWETVCTLLESFIFLAVNQVGFTWILNPCIIPFFPPLSFFPIV